MDQVTTLLEGLAKSLEPYLAKLKPYFADLQPYLAKLETLTGADWRLVLGAGFLGLLVLWLLLRRLLRGGATVKGLESAYEKLAQEGVKELDRPYRLISDRSGWKDLPMAFLWALAEQLRDKRSIIEFLVLAERHGLERKGLRKIARTHKPEPAMVAAAGLLSKLARRRPGEAETALPLAMRLDPVDPGAALTLGARHYDAERFKEAMPLLEQGISLARKLVTQPPPVPTGDDRQDRIRNAADQRRRGDAESLLEKSMEMYEVCLEKGAPSLA